MIETKTMIRLPKKGPGLPHYITDTPDKRTGSNENNNLNTPTQGERISYIKHTPAKKSLSGSTLEEAKVISLTPRMIKNQTNYPQRTALSVIPENSPQ